MSPDVQRGTVERIFAAERLLAIVVSHEHAPPRTDFVTSDDLNLQAGFIVYHAGGAVVPHAHKPVERKVYGTGEVILVRSGCTEIDIFDDERQLVATRRLLPGALVVLIAGGHGFRMLEDTTLIEVKQGPYMGIDEKIRF